MNDFTALISNVQAHTASADAYIRHGWSLVPIPAGTKGPRSPGWHLKTNALKSQADLPPGYGIGLAHAYSGTMALDIDQWDRAVSELALKGIDLEGLYSASDAVVIDSGRHGHGKLLYAMPEGLVLPSKKLIGIGDDGNKFNFLDFRCATSEGTTTQDVLPPSLHPLTGQPYRWAGKGHWTRLPQIPDALLTFWRDLVEQEATVPAELTVSSASWVTIEDALRHISPDIDRDEWIRIGAALHLHGTQIGDVGKAFTLWMSWSAESKKYPGNREMSTQWGAFVAGKSVSVTLGTLFKLARDAGWTQPEPDLSGVFGPVDGGHAVKQVLSPGSLEDIMNPPPPDIDLDLFPEVLRDRAKEVSRIIGCDPLVPLFAGIASVCAAVDSRTRLELLEGFLVPPLMWFMVIGDPAERKTPGAQPMFSGLKAIEDEDKQRYVEAHQAWQMYEASYASAKKAALQYAGTPEFLVNPDGLPPVPTLPPEPVRLQFTISDITSQAAVRSAALRPRGLLCNLDEMASWCAKIADRMSGEDRSFWPQAYECRPYVMERVGAGRIEIDQLSVAFYGNIQPEVFHQFLPSLAQDGMFQRFIPVVLRKRNWGIGENVPYWLTGGAAWEGVLRLTYALPVNTYQLSPGAFDKFREFQSWYAEAKQDERLLDSSSIFLGSFGKLEGTLGRLVLLMHIIESPFATTVSEDLMTRCIRIIRSYVIPSLRHAVGLGGPSTSYDRWLSEWVMQHAEQGTVSLSEIKGASKNHLGGKTTWAQDQMVTTSMSILESAGWVVRLDDGSQGHRHYALWQVNPDLQRMFPDHFEKIVLARQRQKDEIYQLSVSPRKLVPGYNPETMDARLYRKEQKAL